MCDAFSEEELKLCEEQLQYLKKQLLLALSLLALKTHKMASRQAGRQTNWPPLWGQYGQSGGRLGLNSANAERKQIAERGERECHVTKDMLSNESN